MAFRQLYYTSCEQGLSGYAGFQFNAVSVGVDARLMRDVEQLTSYQRPTDVESGAEPVNLCYSVDPTGVAVAAQVVYAGVDPSGRPGNYFAHALATDDPAGDLGGLQPVELWGSPVWRTTPVEPHDLPLLDAEPEPGPIDRMEVAAHLAGIRDGPRLAAAMVTAVVATMHGGRPVVLRGASPEVNAVWIAAVCYLLDPAMARRMSFVTYTSRADRSQVNLIGTIPGRESDAVTTALGGGYVVVDTVDPDPAGVVVHPAAMLLAAAGPVRAAGVWNQARRFAEGTERTLDDWYPPLAAAQALDGAGPELSAEARDVVIGWLVARSRSGTQRLSTAGAGAVLRIVLSRIDELPATLLRELAVVADFAVDQPQVDAIDAELFSRSVVALNQGQVPDPLTDPVSNRGRATAAERLPVLLEHSAWSGVLDLLEWAQRVKMPLDMLPVQRAACYVLGAALDILDGQRLVSVCTRSPAVTQAVVAGLAQHLAESDDVERAVDVLSGEVRGLLDGADLTQHPRLQEYLLLGQVAGREVTPLAAVKEISELRGDTRPALGDPTLLKMLWPSGRWDLAEAAALVALIPVDSAVALPYLRAVLGTPPQGLSEVDQWLRTATEVCHHPLFRQLEPTVQNLMRDASRLRPMLEQADASARVGNPENWYRKPDEAIDTADPALRPVLRRRLARIILGPARQPAGAFAHCSWPVFNECCAAARTILDREPREVGTAARWFAAASATRAIVGARYLDFAVETLVPAVLGWPDKERKHLRRTLADMPIPVLVRQQTAEPPDRGTLAKVTGRAASIWASRKPSQLLEEFDALIAAVQDRGDAPYRGG